MLSPKMSAGAVEDAGRTIVEGESRISGPRRELERELAGWTAQDIHTLRTGTDSAIRRPGA